MVVTTFEPTIAASERPQTHVIEHAATGIGTVYNYNNQIIILEFLLQGCVTWCVRLTVQCEMGVAEKGE